MSDDPGERAPAGKEKPEWLAAAFVIALLAIGVPLWRLPYDRFNFVDAALLPGAVFMAVATLALIARQARPARWVICTMLACAPLIELAVIVRDTSIDARTHDTAPFELITASLLAALFVLAGAGIGLVIRARARHR